MKAKLARLLRREGYSVRLDVNIIGVSGIYHKFDMLIRRNHKIYALELTPRTDNIMTLIKAFAKHIDTNIPVILLVNNNENSLTKTKFRGVYILKYNDISQIIRLIKSNNMFDSEEYM